MGKIREFNKFSAVMIRTDITKELQAIGEKLGVFIELGSGTFTPTELGMRLNITLREGYDGKSGRQTQYERNAFMFGLPDKSFGKSFSYGGKYYKITGIRPKARKNPVLATDSSGKEFIFPADIVKALMIG